MKLQQRIALLTQLGAYMHDCPPALQAAKDKAFDQNPWFVPQFIDKACINISEAFLRQNKLEQWLQAYEVPEQQASPKTIGLTMAGNIPLVGFHDWLTLFVAGHYQKIKPSGKDTVLINHIIQQLYDWEPETKNYFQLQDRLNNCDAYIATGSNNSARYFEYYFGKYPNIIRKNRTSVAILDGDENETELGLLADDLLSYFGLGCRNVSRLFVPQGYNFELLLKALAPYSWMKDHDKFRNNYDYNLSLHLLNNKYYMTDGTLLFIEQEPLFSPIAQVNYSYYSINEKPEDQLIAKFADSLQCICGKSGVMLGKAQQPELQDYADGVDTMQFALLL